VLPQAVLLLVLVMGLRTAVVVMLQALLTLMVAVFLLGPKL
jgi:hypothetical protein